MEAVRRWTSLCARLADASGASVRDEIPKVYSLVTNPFAMVPQVCQSSCSGLEALVTNPAAAGRSDRERRGARLSQGQVSSRGLSQLGAGWSASVGHLRTATTKRVLRAGRGFSRCLVLGFGVQLGPDQHHDDREPDPGHEADDRAERAVGFIETAEIGGVPG